MKKYVCPTCGTIHTTNLEKKECKARHIDVEKIKGMQYKATEKYPNRINVQFEDGQVVTFRRG